MAQIKPYKKQDGTINYMFDYYVGVNPKTGKNKKPLGGDLKQKRKLV